jgi:hypothetical protein
LTGLVAVKVRRSAGMVKANKRELRDKVWKVRCEAGGGWGNGPVNGRHDSMNGEQQV